jgi:hypothetical protein
MTEVAKNWFNRVMAGLFMSSALVIALLVGLQGRAEGRGWFSCIFMGAIAGVLFSYAAVLVLMLVATAVRRVSSLIEKR